MADFAWLDEFLADKDPARARALLRAVTEQLVKDIQAHTGVDWGPKIEHRCYEILNEPSTEIEPPPPPAAASPYRGSTQPTQARQTTCVGCGRQIAESESNITERGALCDTCFAG